MSEKHFAYKITLPESGIVCTHAEIEQDKMVDLLKEIQHEHFEGIFWIFKQFGDHPKEPLCIIDCAKNRIYYHYSGEIDDLEETIKNLSRLTNKV